MRDEWKQSFEMRNVNADISISLSHSLTHSHTHTHTHTCKKRIEYNRTHLHNKCDYVLTRNFSVIAANSYVRVQGSVPWLFMLHV